jgi:hypothetical protein
MKELTNVTIDRSPNHHVIVPHNRVDAIKQTSNGSPAHKQAGARIPSYAVCPQNAAPMTEISSHTFEVPIEGNGTHHEANEREGRKQLVRRAHCSSRTQFD